MGITNPYYTRYATRTIPQETLEDVVALWGQALWDPVYPRADQFTMERQVVLEEILLRNVPDFEHVETNYLLNVRKLSRILFDEDIGSKWSGEGFSRIVAGLGPRQVRSFHRACYTPQRIVVIVASEMPSADVFSLVSRRFARYPVRELKDSRVPPRARKPDHLVVTSSPQLLPGNIGLLMGFIAPGADSFEGFTVDIDLLPLWRGSGPWLLVLSGKLTARANGIADYPHLENAFRELIRSLTEKPPEQHELEFLRNRRTLDNASSSKAVRLSSYILFSSLEAFQQEEQWLADMTTDQLWQTAKEIFDVNHAALIIHGEGLFLFELRTAITFLLFLACVVLPALLILGLHSSISSWITEGSVFLYLSRPLARASVLLSRLTAYLLFSILLLSFMILFIQLTFLFISGEAGWDLWQLFPILALIQVGVVIIHIGLLFSVRNNMAALVISLILLGVGNYSLIILDAFQDSTQFPIVRVSLKAIYTILPKYDQLQTRALYASFGTDPASVTHFALFHFIGLILVMGSIGVIAFERKEFR